MAEASRLAGLVLDEVQRAVVGKREALTLVMAAILAKGHVLLEDFPGLGKTLAAASSLDKDLKTDHKRGAMGAGDAHKARIRLIFRQARIPGCGTWPAMEPSTVDP